MSVLAGGPGGSGVFERFMTMQDEDPTQDADWPNQQQPVGQDDIQLDLEEEALERPASDPGSPGIFLRAIAEQGDGAEAPFPDDDDRRPSTNSNTNPNTSARLLGPAAQESGKMSGLPAGLTPMHLALGALVLIFGFGAGIGVGMAGSSPAPAPAADTPVAAAAVTPAPTDRSPTEATTSAPAATRGSTAMAMSQADLDAMLANPVG